MRKLTSDKRLDGNDFQGHSGKSEDTRRGERKEALFENVHI